MTSHPRESVFWKPISAPRCQRVLHLVLRLVLHRAPRFSEGGAFPFVKPIAEMGLR